MDQSLSRGFSLIELMIVVSILSILTLFALPSYKIYAQRARFAEVVSLCEPYKLAIAVALQQGLSMDQLESGNNDIPSSPSKTKNLEDISVHNGIITATATALLENSTYILKPNNDGTQWTVSGSCIKKKLCSA